MRRIREKGDKEIAGLRVHQGLAIKKHREHVVEDAPERALIIRAKLREF
jgi:hypothetical protein